MTAEAPPGLEPYAVFPIARMIELFGEPRLEAGSIPLTTFSGQLRQHRSEMQNDKGRAVMRAAFPLFDNLTVQSWVARERALGALGLRVDERQLSLEAQAEEAGVRTVYRVHRRFAGSDGLLERGCYHSLCTSPSGFDGMTLVREMFSYRDARLPGAVFVGDSFDPKVSAAVGGDQISYKPGWSGIYVFLIPPMARADAEVWREVYAAVLGPDWDIETPFVTLFEVRSGHQTIENVVDLRLPATQSWFVRQFAHGSLPWLYKKDERFTCFFTQLLPALMHHQNGGIAVTHAIGSWLRAAGVDALIFPSARADAAVTFDGEGVGSFAGWNLVDYRSSRGTPPTEGIADYGIWPDDFPDGISIVTQDRGEAGWKVDGNERDYWIMRHKLFG